MIDDKAEKVVEGNEGKMKVVKGWGWRERPKVWMGIIFNFCLDV